MTSSGQPVELNVVIDRLMSSGAAMNADTRNRWYSR
jgi:hypothetical protein